MNEQAKDYFGTTNKLSEVGYILSDGSLLDFSGKKFGSRGGYRAYDHREISKAFDMYNVTRDDFINNGNIRYMPENESFIMSRKPTIKQLAIMKIICDRNNGEISIELNNDAKNDDGFYRDYEEGTDFKKVQRDIYSFYTLGKVSDVSGFVSEHKQYNYKKKFEDRVKKHIDRVNKYASKVGKSFPNHDKDKLVEPMLSIYSLDMKSNYEKLNNDEREKLRKAGIVHRGNNQHHPEFFDKGNLDNMTSLRGDPTVPSNCQKMSKLAMIEMCADWCAMSEEFGNSPFDWFHSKKGVRWIFSKDQEKYIDDILHKMWDKSDEPIKESVEKLNNIYESKKINEEAYKYNPLYHGTDSNFNEFKKEYQKGGYLGNGFYFTMSKSMAQTYGPIIMQVKLNYQNSFFLSSDKLSDQQVREMLNTTKAQNYQKNDIFNIYKSYITDNAYYDANSKLFDFIDTYNGDSTAILQKYGYDSIDNIDRDSEIVVFEPKQIEIIKNNINESSFYGNVNWQNNMDALGNVSATIGYDLFATMFPSQFLMLCPKYSYGDDDWFDKQIDKKTPFGIPFLKVDVDEKNKQLIVINHEGRHWVKSVKRRNPNVDIPVAILYNKDKYILPDNNILRKEWTIVSQDGKTEFSIGKISLYNEFPKQSAYDLYDIYKERKELNEERYELVVDEDDSWYKLGFRDAYIKKTSPRYITGRKSSQIVDKLYGKYIGTIYDEENYGPFQYIKGYQAGRDKCLSEKSS